MAETELAVRTPRGTERQRVRLLIDVATQYYVTGLNQNQIAQRIGCSRATVSRLLDEARASRIVTVKIGHPLEHVTRLEEALSSRLPGVTFRIAEGAESANPVAAVAAVAVELLMKEVEDGLLVGLSPGSTVAAMGVALAATPGLRPVDVEFVQLIGEISTRSAAVAGSQLCRDFAAAFHGGYQALPAPLVARDRAAAAVFCENGAIAGALDVARSVDIAFVGVGKSVDQMSRQDILFEWIGPDVQSELVKLGCACHMLGRFLDSSGRVLPHSINDRVIGLSLDELARVPRVVLVAGGISKAGPIVAAVRGGYAREVVVDFNTATRMVTLLDREEMSGSVGNK